MRFSHATSELVASLWLHTFIQRFGSFNIYPEGRKKVSLVLVEKFSNITQYNVFLVIDRYTYQIFDA